MKNQSQCYQALLNGKTLINGKGMESKMVNGFNETFIDGKETILVHTYANYWEWEVKPETKTITKEDLAKVSKIMDNTESETIEQDA